MRCRNCDYNLENLTKNRCPECGTSFDPDDLNTLARSRMRRAAPLIAVFTIILCITLVPVFFSGGNGAGSLWFITIVLAATFLYLLVKGQQRSIAKIRNRYDNNTNK